MSLSILLDFETLDTAPTAVVTEIGAIAILREHENVRIIDHLALCPDILGQLADGRTFSRDTILWHQKQPDPVRIVPGPSLAACTTLLAAFIDRHQPRRIWAWGKDFERPLYENICNASGIKVPDYQFRQFACARDQWHNAFGLEAHAPKRTHHALQDCKDELRDLVTALNALDIFHVI